MPYFCLPTETIISLEQFTCIIFFLLIDVTTAKSVQMSPLCMVENNIGIKIIRAATSQVLKAIKS